MRRFDCNCFAGNWPFHYIRRNTPQKLLELHRKATIDSGLISSLEAVFYRDPWEADARLLESINGTPYLCAQTMGKKMSAVRTVVLFLAAIFLLSFLPTGGSTHAATGEANEAAQVLHSLGLCARQSLRALTHSCGLNERSVTQTWRRVHVYTRPDWQRPNYVFALRLKCAVLPLTKTAKAAAVTLSVAFAESTSER